MGGDAGREGCLLILEGMRDGKLRIMEKWKFGSAKIQLFLHPANISTHKSLSINNKCHNMTTIRQQNAGCIQLDLFPEMLPIPDTNVKGEDGLSELQKRVSGFCNLDLLLDAEPETENYSLSVKAFTGSIPRQLIAFSKAAKSKTHQACVHFFEYDFMIERFWNTPRKYLRMLKAFQSVISPDYSISYDVPDAVNEWNIFRNYALARIMQLQGIKVIPNIPVCLPRLYDKVFTPLESGGIYIISNVRAHANYFTRHEWYKFVREAVQRLAPKALLIYGNRMTVSGVQAFYYDNENIIRLRNGKK